MSFSRLGLDDDAIRGFRQLIEAYPGVVAFRVGEAESLMNNGQVERALERYAEGNQLSPRNQALTVSYAEALIEAGQADVAHRILLDLLHHTDPTAEHFRLIARAANAEGDIGNAHHYMSHFYIAIGNLPLAINQIRMALEAPDVNRVDRARFATELADLNAYLPEQRKRRQEREESEQQARAPAP